MRIQTPLLIFAAMFGTTLLAACVVFWPNLSLSTAFIPHVYLPQPEDRTEPLPEPKLTLFFAGDIMLARGVEWRIAKEGVDYPLGAMNDIVSDADIAIANFEGTIREQENIEDGSKMTFDTTPAVAAIPITAGFDVFSLANNHGDDYGSAVASSTREALELLGATTFGDPFDSPSHIARIDRNGFAISLVGYHAFGEEYEPVADAIIAEKAAGRFVIVFPHWGPEYTSTPHASAEVEPAHAFVDAGADLIIGAHPHVIQTIETYSGTPIIYSLGNFLFDQDWSTPTQQGMTVQVTLTGDDVTLGFGAVHVSLQKTTPMTADETASLLAAYNIPQTLTVTRK